MPDVVVYGATAAGVMAAAAAAERGAATTLVGPDRHVGGMVSGGLGWTDVGDVDVVRGLARTFYEDVAAHYDAPLWGVRGPEPHVAERLLEARLGKVEVRLGEPLAAVATSGARIARLSTSGGAYDAAVYVDAGYEGDLLARAGVPYAVGRGNIDIRKVERTWRYLPEYERTPAVFNEGYLSVAVPPSPIPLRALMPRRQDCENLYVPVCLSASHVAFGSVRMEPTLMLLGEAAGAAAAEAAREIGRKAAR